MADNIQFSDLQSYRGYIGTIEYSKESMCFYGKIKNIRDFVNYEASRKEDLESAFHAAVDDYIQFKREMEDVTKNQPL